MSVKTFVFGWDLAQWAYAKQRHKLHGGGVLSADMQGMLALREWWEKNQWAAPLSLRLEGVVLESDHEWVAEAVKDVTHA